ncbi:hypothetical protein DFP72DRAFT_1081079 [Ephemerocybe angulata]|uniref:Uncharacterized protein n=1 Tax=Ephemerocybe angulata TaxID=980116 RepID=A0A8H6HAH9_9AGAR|nr:hypothetical protein DFP72DRAFT_1081079 [Tulosesus angulatus]
MSSPALCPTSSTSPKGADRLRVLVRGAASRTRVERRRSGRWSAYSSQGGSQSQGPGGCGFGERGRGRASPSKRGVVIGWDGWTIYLEEATYAGTITSHVNIDIASGAERTVLGDCPAIPDLLAD